MALRKLGVQEHDRHGYNEGEGGMDMVPNAGMPQSRSVTIGLSPEVDSTVRRRAAERGRPVSEYLREVIERSVMSFDEILAPIRDGFERSGLSEEELDQLFAEAREEVSAAGWDCSSSPDEDLRRPL
jgi:hypothetical protein